MDFDNIDVNLDDIRKPPGPSYDDGMPLGDDDIEDELEIPIDEDESGSGIRKESNDIPISDNYAMDERNTSNEFGKDGSFEPSDRELP